ncbi:hypothetical protein JTB14_030443 [Gonioctena quinquepunctata]|nr:hypothetical protein JTB14_030443 [Gonioctena quinquepunctata]
MTFVYNTAKQATTKLSPFILVYGREPIMPTQANLMEPRTSLEANEMREKVLAIRNTEVNNIKASQSKYKVRYDGRHRQLDFKAGDKVKIFTPLRKVGRSEKLLLKWFGPYEIIRKVGEVDYEIQKGSSKESNFQY